MITLFGATGYTGQLIAHELAAAGLPFRIAGRSAERLRALAAELPGNPPILLADATRPDTLPVLVDGTQVLINCAGPFTDLGEAVTRAAAQAGIRYLDTTNELGYVFNTYQRLHQLARASGAVLVPACAFEVALADCAAALLAPQLEQPQSVDVVYALPGMGSSHGTRASAIRSLATSWLAYRGGQHVAAWPGAATRTFQIAGQARPAIAFPSSELVTIPAHLAVQDVTAWMQVSAAARRYGPLVLRLGAPLLRGPLGTLLRRLAERAAPPPAPSMRLRMPFTIAVLLHDATATIRMDLRGVDPYGLTARIAVYAARRLLDTPLLAGVLAPAQALDPAAFLATARTWGVSAHEITAHR